MADTANMLHGHVDPSFLHTCSKIQPTVTSTSHVIAKCNINKYAHQILYRLIYDMYTHLNATYEVPGINHATRSTVHIFEIYH